MFRWIADAAACQPEPEGRGGIPIFFALFWSVFIGFVCVVIGRGAVRQVMAAGWPTTDGVVTVSEPGGKKNGAWKLAYEYTVGGRAYTGTEYAHNPMPVQGEEEVRRHVAAYPVGAAVVVYYDPANSANAVLRPGLRGCTLWVALLLTPFVIIGLAMWVGIARRGRPGFDPDDPRQVAETDAGTVVRLDRTRWPAIFLTYLGVAAFAVAWCLAFVGHGIGVAYQVFDGFLLDPPVEVPAVVWAAVLAGSAAGAWWSVRRAPVLTLDAVRGQLLLAAAGRAHEVPFQAVREVTVDEEPVPNSNPPAVRCRVELDRADGDPLAVAEYGDRAGADALADWLRDRLAGRPAGHTPGERPA